VPCRNSIGTVTPARCAARAVPGLPGGCSGNPHEDQPAHAVERLDGLALGRHATAEGLAARTVPELVGKLTRADILAMAEEDPATEAAATATKELNPARRHAVAGHRAPRVAGRAPRDADACRLTIALVCWRIHASLVGARWRTHDALVINASAPSRGGLPTVGTVMQHCIAPEKHRADSHQEHSMTNLRTSTVSLAIAAMALAASAALAAEVPEPETPGSAAAQAVAEAKHLARVHGIDPRAPQPQAQTAGDARAQAVAEAMHLKKSHGVINDSADQRLEFDHPAH
jgi:hypothetical protein